MKRKSLKLLLLAATVLGAALLAYLAVKPAEVIVETTTLRREPFEETIRTDGRFQSRTRYVVQASASGVIGTVTLRPGDAVAKGQVITTLDWDRHDVVRAPLGGVVSKIHREGGGPITRGDLILEIVDASRLEVALELLTSDAVRVKPGFEVRVSGWGGPELTAKVTSVSRAGFVKLSSLGVEEERTEVRAELENPPKDVFAVLGDRFHLEATIVLSHDADVLTVPLGALFREKEGWAVYVVQKNRAELRSVRVGRQNEREAVVLDGLNSGDVVILYPSDALRPGLRVVTR